MNRGAGCLTTLAAGWRLRAGLALGAGQRTDVAGLAARNGNLGHGRRPERLDPHDGCASKPTKGSSALLPRSNQVILAAVGNGNAIRPGVRVPLTPSTAVALAQRHRRRSMVPCAGSRGSFC